MHMWLFLLLIVGVFAQQDVELTKLYTSTNGGTWINKTNWLNGDPCSWFGVGCQNGNVVVLDLSNNHLTGTLPTNFSISTLSIFRLGDNSLLTGTIPDYSSMNLTEIYLNNTGLTGSFPTWFANVPTLETISLSSSDLSGHFPDEWCDMPSIKKISLGAQNITGGLPDCIGDLTTLTVFEIVSAPLGGFVPQTISNLQNLEILTLVDTGIVGVLPTSMSTNLIEMRLKGNHLTGSFPSSIQSMENIVYLSLASNFFSGTIPQWLGNMKLLYLDIRCNNFVGPVPEWLQEEPSSPNVLFSCNNITNLPSWCAQGSHCGSSGCEGTRCEASSSSSSEDGPPNKAVIIALAIFLGLLVIGNGMLVVFLVRRKCMRYDHTAEMKPILSPRSIRRHTGKESEEAYH